MTHEVLTVVCVLLSAGNEAVTQKVIWRSIHCASECYTKVFNCYVLHHGSPVNLSSNFYAV